MKDKFQALFYYLNYPITLVKAWLKLYFIGNYALTSFIQKANRNYTVAILKKFGANIGKTPNFNGKIIIDNTSLGSKPFKNIYIGDNCFIGTDVFFDLPDEIILENNAILSAGVKILTHQDCGGRPMSKYYPRKVGKVIIGENSWIGLNVVILAGVSIGKNSVVAAGAVVTKNIPAFSVAAGNPAKIIKSLI
ncbi:MAG: hypothetical protein AUJ98_10700 [Bacteroidetes bacterium CG2_30_33_31]|nr:MAG: hypothetical protein AUJ98_10700 [Bacteroidetes bacterium CG2_30_33_31]